MRPKIRGKKQVRIRSGHQARFIEKRNLRRCAMKKSKTQFPQKSTCCTCRGGHLGRFRTHRPTVSELVYQFLERASNCAAMSSQKRSATRLLRKFQRGKRARKPDCLVPRVHKARGLERPQGSYQFPYESLPTEKASKSVENCIYEVLTFATILGFLRPADKKGTVFRVASDLELFPKKRDTDELARKFSDRHEDVVDKTSGS